MHAGVSRTSLGVSQANERLERSEAGGRRFHLDGAALEENKSKTHCSLAVHGEINGGIVLQQVFVVALKWRKFLASTFSGIHSPLFVI